MKKIHGNKQLEKSIKECKLLAIDEVSMMSNRLIDYLDKVLKKVRENNTVFGGLQVILIGDFFQIPPVKKQNDVDTDFCFNSLAWNKLNLATIYLKEVKRQSDKEYIKALNNIRIGNITKEVSKIFENRNHPQDYVFDKNILQIFARNVDADNYNKKCFDELSTTPYTYSATDTFYRYDIETGKCIESIILENNSKDINTEETYLVNSFNKDCRAQQKRL